MGIPVCLTVILIGVFFMHIFSESASSRNKKKIKEFLDEQNNIYILPKETLNNLEFINVEFSKIKFKPRSKESKLAVKELKDFETKKICNFNNLSNNELKKMYGTNNFDDILKYQTTYDELLSKLVYTAELLIQDGDDVSAITLLEMSIKFNNDISKNYTLLADLYAKHSMRDKFFELIDLIKSNSKLSQSKILKHISKLQESKRKGE